MTQQDDITQRLRDNADLDEAEHGNARVVQLERDAADEIERLRAELSKLRAPVADERQAVAYLDLGTGGYMDMDTDLTDEELAALPKGRHMLAIIGTHGVNGYTPVSAPVADESAIRRALVAASNYIDTLGGDSRSYRAALASAPVAGEAVTDEMIQAGAKAAREYFERTGGNDPAVIYSAMRAAAPAAPQASALAAEYTRGRADGFDAGQSAALEKAAAALEDHRKAGREWVPGSLWDTLSREAAARIRALKQPQADKDGAEQALKDLVTHGVSVQRIAPADFMADRQPRAVDVDVDRLMAAAKGMTRLYSYVWDRTDGCLVVFPENVRAFDAAFDALRMATGEAVADAPQAEQGERDAQD